jgi:hypothetical protein
LGITHLPHNMYKVRVGFGRLVRGGRVVVDYVKYRARSFVGWLRWRFGVAFEAHGGVKPCGLGGVVCGERCAVAAENWRGVEVEEGGGAGDGRFVGGGSASEFRDCLPADVEGACAGCVGAESDAQGVQQFELFHGAPSFHGAHDRGDGVGCQSPVDTPAIVWNYGGAGGDCLPAPRDLVFPDAATPPAISLDDVLRALRWSVRYARVERANGFVPSPTSRGAMLDWWKYTETFFALSRVWP